jgi:hypothetical protein
VAIAIVDPEDSPIGRDPEPARNAKLNRARSIAAARRK